MITYYKKNPITKHIELCEVTNAIELCGAIEYSLEEILAKADRYSIYYHTPSLQIRIRIKYDNSLQINMNINPEEYDYLLCDTVVQADYAIFIIELRNRIREMILKDYMK